MEASSTLGRVNVPALNVGLGYSLALVKSMFGLVKEIGRRKT